MSTSGTHGFSSGDTYNILPPFDVDPSLLDIVPNTQEFVPIPGRAMYHKDLLLIEGNGEVHLSQEEYDEIASLFTDTPIAPTAPVDTNTTQIATTAFVIGQASDDNPLMNNTVNAGTSKRYSRKDHIHPVDTSRAPVNNPTLAGTVTVPDTSFTYAKLQNVSAADKILGRVSAGAGVIEEITCTAAGRAILDDATATNQRITIGLGNVTNESKATMFASPAFTGNPTAPTPEADDDSTQIANTAFIKISNSNIRDTLGLNEDFPDFKPTVIRNPQMDNNRNIWGRQVYNNLSSGAFTTDMIGKPFKCTDVGSSTRDFREGTTALLKIANTGVLLAADTPLVLNTVYVVYAAGTPDNWGSSVLTPFDQIQVGKWYIPKTDTVTYAGTTYNPPTFTPGEDASFVDANITWDHAILGTTAGGTTFTGSGTLYEFDGIVIEEMTGNGATTGTLKLNYIPEVDLTPVTGKEWSIRPVHPSTTVVIVTRVDYATRIVNISATNGHNLSSSELFVGNAVSFINPFNSSIVCSFQTSELLTGGISNYWMGSDHYFGNVGGFLFKRKTDNYYCAMFQAGGFNLAGNDPGTTVNAHYRYRIGYYLASDVADYSTYVLGNNSKPIIDGVLTDTYISTGTLVSGKKYKIIATQTNHFVNGYVAGDYFVSAGTETCDANNRVRLVDDNARYVSTMGSVYYIGEVNGKHVWEGYIDFLNKEYTIHVPYIVRFDETFSDEHMKFIPLDVKFRVYGDSYDSTVAVQLFRDYIYYDGKHRLISYCSMNTGDAVTGPRPLFEVTSSANKYGPYDTRTLIHLRDANNPATIEGREFSSGKYFVYNSKLYFFGAAEPLYNFAGIQWARRSIVLWRFSESNNKWYPYHKNPIIVAPIYGGEYAGLWAGTGRAESHLGDQIALYIEGTTAHIILTVKSSGYKYDLMYASLDLTSL